jgi:hypothetical protein
LHLQLLQQDFQFLKTAHATPTVLPARAAPSGNAAANTTSVAMTLPIVQPVVMLYLEFVLLCRLLRQFRPQQAHLNRQMGAAEALLVTYVQEQCLEIAVPNSDGAEMMKGIVPVQDARLHSEHAQMQFHQALSFLSLLFWCQPQNPNRSSSSTLPSSLSPF